MNQDREHRMKLGQFFTKTREVDFMINLIQGGSKILEPACGDGAFLSNLRGFPLAHALELDASVAHPSAIIMDFFDFAEDNKYDTVIGNPPYVANALILEETRDKLAYLETWSGKTNLFVCFMEKCLNHLREKGELIFIVPSVFLQATTCVPLNKRMYKEGTITHFVDFGDKSPFGSDALPEYGTCIFRYSLGDTSRTTMYYNLVDEEIVFQENRKYYVDEQGITYFLNSGFDINSVVSIKDYFSVKVGAVSGMDGFFADDLRGNKDFVCSKTRATGELKRMIHEDKPTRWLQENKSEIAKRKIKSKWTHKDWWKWGREHHVSDAKRIYVNNKTRQENPFFCNDCKNYDGSVLGIFFKDDRMSPEKVKDMFNSLDWKLRFMKVGGRYIFKQRSLENCFLTKENIDSCYEENKEEN